MREGVVSATQC